MDKAKFTTGGSLVLAGLPMTQLNQQWLGYSATIIGTLVLLWGWYGTIKTVRIRVDEKNAAVFALDGFERAVKIFLVSVPVLIVAVLYLVLEGSHVTDLLKAGFRTKVSCAPGEVIKNREIVIDGYFYKDCKFENVTFYYNGDTSFQLPGVFVTGQIHIRTDNQKLGNMLSFIQQFGLINPNVPLTVIDANGKHTYP